MEDATRETDELKEKLMVNKEEIEDLVEQLSREQSIRKNIEKSISQKKFPSELILPGGVITHTVEDDDPENSISQNYYSFSMGNLHNVASSTPIRGNKPVFGTPKHGSSGNLTKSKSLKFKTELQSELHLENLKSQLKKLEEEKSKMVTEF